MTFPHTRAVKRRQVLHKANVLKLGEKCEHHRRLRATFPTRLRSLSQEQVALRHQLPPKQSRSCGPGGHLQSHQPFPPTEPCLQEGFVHDTRGRKPCFQGKEGFVCCPETWAAQQPASPGENDTPARTLGLVGSHQTRRGTTAAGGPFRTEQRAQATNPEPAERLKSIFLLGPCEPPKPTLLRFAL